MKKQLLLLPLLLIFKLSQAVYNLASLPDSLLQNANAVVREFSTHVVINNDLSFSVRVHKVITIFNQEANDQSRYYGYESREASSKLIQGIIYDANGVAVKKVKRGDINTVGEYSQFISDFKEEYYDPEILKYPFTVEYDYETKYDYLLYLPEFAPFPDYNISVLHASYEIDFPETSEIRFYNSNNTWQPEVGKKEKLSSYTFAITNKNAIEKETSSPEYEEVEPRIIVAPGQINYYGYKNKFVTWDDFGSWIQQLNNNRDSLPADVSQRMRIFKTTYPDVVERAKAIYSWMQDNTRYYSIQLGIGGYQPMLAMDVNKKKYGDCKALAFFTKTLLKAAGIDAYYTLVYAGKNKNIVKQMPANQFNHVILCMPVNADTIWMECTDQKIPFGFLGDFTDDRDVLVMNDKPSIAHTKSYTEADNTKKIVAHINIDEEQSTGDLEYSARGLQSQKLFTMAYLPSTDRKDKYLYDLLNVNNLNIVNYSVNTEKNIIPTTSLSANITINTFIHKVGSKLVFEPNIFTKYTKPFLHNSDRTLPIEQEENYSETDSLFFILPENYVLTNSGDVNIHSKYGDYKMEFKKTGNNEVSFFRRLTIHKGVFPASEQNAYEDFIKSLTLADKTRAILTIQN